MPIASGSFLDRYRRDRSPQLQQSVVGADAHSCSGEIELQYSKLGQGAGGGGRGTEDSTVYWTANVASVVGVMLRFVPCFTCVLLCPVRAVDFFVIHVSFIPFRCRRQCGAPHPPGAKYNANVHFCKGGAHKRKRNFAAVPGVRFLGASSLRRH